MGLFWALLELFSEVAVAAHGGGGVGGTKGSSWCGGWSARGVWVIFGSLADSIYRKHELGFIEDIASFQLTQISSDLVMF